MWVGKFKIEHDCWISDKTTKYNISAVGIPLQPFEKDGKKYHTGIDFLRGSEKNKEHFIASLKKNKRIKNVDVYKNQLILLIEGEDFIAQALDPSLFFVSPVLQEKGYEVWEIGSWEKKTLTGFLEKIKEFAKVEILKLKKESPKLIIHQALPKMTAKQESAYQLAQELGYYEYPRKVSVEKLAKKAKIPRTTFQAHLRKAESKVMGMLKNSF